MNRENRNKKVKSSNNDENSQMNKSSYLSNEQKTLVHSLKNFLSNTELIKNPYVQLYQSIISNPIYGNHLSFSPKRRAEFISKFALNKELINKPYLCNLINCHVNKIIGYFTNTEEQKMYLIEGKISCNGTSYIEKIVIPEKILQIKLGQSCIIVPMLENNEII